MSKRVVFRHMDHSQVLEEYANQKMAKIDTFLEHEKTPITINLIFEPSKAREHHKIELRITSPDYHVIAMREHQGEKFYEELDHVIDIAYRELLKQKEKRITDRKQNHNPRPG